MFGLTTTRRLRAEVAAARAADADRLRAERDAALKDASAHKAAAETSARLYVEADEKYVDTCIVNETLTTDLTKAREKLAEYGGRRTVAEVLEEHDVHRKALADALGEGKRHLGWDALIGEAGGLAGTVTDLRADCEVLKERADRHQQLLAEGNREADGEWKGRARRAEARVTHLERELDNALGMPPGGLLDSARWQPGYQDPKPGTKASTS